MKKFAAYYYQSTKRGVKERIMYVEAVSRGHAFAIAKETLPRHSRMGNVYTVGSEPYKLAKAGLL